MKAAVLYEDGKLRIEDRPRPMAHDGEVVVKVGACGVSYYDASVLAGKLRSEDYPVVLGHELAGTVEDIGRGVVGVEKGDHVAIYPVAACGSCFYCQREMQNLCLHENTLGSQLEGGLAEFVRVPRQIVDLYGLPKISSLPIEQACMANIASDCLHTFEILRLRMGDVLAIMGSGQNAMMYLLMAKSRQLRTIVCDNDEEGLKLASLLGADRTLNPRTVDPADEVRRMTGLGADAAVICETVDEGIGMALRILRRGGTLAVPVSPVHAHKVEVDVRWMRYGHMSIAGVVGSTPWTFREAVGLLATGEVDVNPLISHTIKLEDVPDLFQVNDHAAHVRKAVVVFT
jgi:L-iditol 2-dehydrogenase